jgi:ethanolamine utilization microcompartment shell protein EutS
VLPDGILNNYTDVTTCSCSYCAAVCAAPAVDAAIGFLDGFSGKRVGYCYLAFVSFTLVY